MEDLPEEEEETSGDMPSRIEVLNGICEEMKGLLTAAETLLQPDQDDSISEGPEVEES